MKRFIQLSCITAVLAVSAVAIAQTGGYSGPNAAPAATAPAAKAAAGGYSGPSGVPLMTAKDLLASGKDDQHVRLKGRLLNHKGDEEYEFADASGRITVEIDDKLFPAGVKVDHTTEVELVGEFDKEMIGESKLDVDQLKVVAR
ncbi:NirD/YgiW/YdeI family stress tolerance protein [Massilia dura]|uniref:NirD/YgiW/YdeI family stress tolerance protein n=1 Tax=Pseudoduganella dura TaxID=321982 RepID=A0A6I3XE94_9BURK|nr:NirD/YgiW/YdeI family stress tolerance protein [Pseudoduganella dura]MUI12840.1 NirD/YgiW/YdeI family stress tolerance protein [Pseudoduganella dura]GGX92843.1 exported protein [Pseudoduganella dura]